MGNLEKPEGLSPKVSVVQRPGTKYPQKPPFDPAEQFPEFTLGGQLDPSNQVYGQVRESLLLLGLDSDRFGESDWNPLGDVVRPGDAIVIKPNLCKHVHHLGTEGVLATVTHGSVLRPIIDYCLIALEGSGSITVCDTPFEDTQWDVVMEETGIADMIRSVSDSASVPVRLLDLREYKTEYAIGYTTTEQSLAGDPAGYVHVDLGESSMFTPLDEKTQNYHTLADHTVDHYDPFSTDIGTPNQHHHPGKHEYRISKTILSADVLISVPKLKTHGKAGVTLNVKNMIGTVAGKTYMPHHRPGSPPLGDAFNDAPPERYVRNRVIRRQFGRLFNFVDSRLGGVGAAKLAPILRRGLLDTVFPASRQGIVEWGDWWGNDTIWRTCTDLITAALFATEDGKLHSTQQRRFLSFVDGIYGQEAQGPSAGRPVRSGVIVAGTSPITVDTVAADIMGFDSEKLPVISGSSSRTHHGLGEHRIDHIDVQSSPTSYVRNSFEPPNAWAGTMERDIEQVGK